MNWEDTISRVVSGLLVFAILTALGWAFATAYISETDVRIEHNRIHMREMGRGK